MEQKLALGKYPIFSHEVNKNSCKYKTASEIVNYLKTQIDNNPMVAFIGIFDHYAHTKKLILLVEFQVIFLILKISFFALDLKFQILISLLFDQDLLE